MLFSDRLFQGRKSRVTRMYLRVSENNISDPANINPWSRAHPSASTPLRGVLLTHPCGAPATSPPAPPTTPPNYPHHQEYEQIYQIRCHQFRREFSPLPFLTALPMPPNHPLDS
jgi:hypothetical protein